MQNFSKFCFFHLIFSGVLYLLVLISHIDAHFISATKDVFHHIKDTTCFSQVKKNVHFFQTIYTKVFPGPKFKNNFFPASKYTCTFHFVGIKCAM